ncbi:MAG: hypothetical protein LBI18_12500, partial [Planctomycetaceae bacterium]|nr:hypothetical protein [Planctomycetaceae bacterium]
MVELLVVITIIGVL